VLGDRALEVVDEQLADHRPGAPLHALEGGLTECSPFRVVPDQIDDVSPKLPEIARGVQPSGARRVDEIDRSAPRSRDHRHSGCHRLLNCLAKGLEFTGVHEEINAGERDEIFHLLLDGEAADKPISSSPFGAAFARNAALRLPG